MLLRVFCNMGRHHRYSYVVAGPFWFPMHFLAYVCLEHLFVLVKLYIRNFFSKASNIIDSVKGQHLPSLSADLMSSIGTMYPQMNCRYIRGRCLT